MTFGEVRAVGDIEKSRGVEPRGKWRSITDFGLTFVRSGTGEFRRPNAPATMVAAPCLILTLPHHPHWFGPGPGETWSESFIIFRGPVFEWMLTAHGFSVDRLVLHLDSSDLAGRRFQALRSATDAMGPLIDLLQGFATSPASEHDAWVTKVDSLLRSPETQGDNVDLIAERLRLTRAEFVAAYKRVTGKSPTRRRIEIRIDGAKTLLSFTGLSCREIAVRLGYADEFVFSRQFRRETGTSPTAFRASHRGQGAAERPDTLPEF